MRITTESFSFIGVSKHSRASGERLLLREGWSYSSERDRALASGAAGTSASTAAGCTEEREEQKQGTSKGGGSSRAFSPEDYTVSHFSRRSSAERTHSTGDLYAFGTKRAYDCWTLRQKKRRKEQEKLLGRSSER